MLTKKTKNFGSKYCRKDGNILKKQQILGDFQKELKELQKELYRYVEEPPYLKRQLSEIESKIQKENEEMELR